MSLQSLASDLKVLGIRYHIVIAASAKKSSATLKAKQQCNSETAIKWFSALGKKPLEFAGVIATPKRGGVTFKVKDAVLSISTTDNRMSIKIAGKDMPITASVFMDITDRLAHNNYPVLKYIMRRFKYWASVMAKPAYLEKIRASKRTKASHTSDMLVCASSEATEATEAIAVESLEYGLWTGWNVITPSGLCLKTTSGIKGVVPAKVLLKDGKYKAYTTEKQVADWRAGILAGRSYCPDKYTKTAADCREIELDHDYSADESQGLEDVMTPGPDQVACPMASVACALI